MPSEGEEKLIAGKYQLLKELATGGMAEVFLACQTGVDGFKKLVVVKRILPHLASDEQFVQMFLDEARTAADLRHPNVVTIFDVGPDDGSYYIAMEYLHGMNLREISGELEAPFPLGISLQIAIDVARGLHYAHTKKDLTHRPLGIIHRDVSPHNIVVTFQGYTKLVDFGIARAQSKRSHTAPGIIRGKLAYMSPEQAAGLDLDPRSDLFSLGVLMYEMTTGARLYQKGAGLPCQLALDSAIPLPSTKVDDFPDELEIVIMRALAADRDDRWPDCKEMADALEELLAFQRIPHSQARVGDWLTRTFPERNEVEPALQSSDPAPQTQPTVSEDDPTAPTLKKRRKKKADEPTTIEAPQLSDPAETEAD